MPTTHTAAPKGLDKVQPIDAALEYAAELDTLLATQLSDEMEEVLVHGVGQLTGGLSANGFAADLRAHLDGLVEEDERDEEYAPYAGGWVRTGASWLTAAGEDAQDSAAVEWLAQARKLLDALPMAEAA